MRELEEGLTFGARFRLIRRLGRGGMGEVWLARDDELNENIALKILDPGLAESPEFVELLRSECRKARRLVHPNIVHHYVELEDLRLHMFQLLIHIHQSLCLLQHILVRMVQEDIFS